VAGQLINQLRQRDFILCHRGNDYFGFVHRTFLEYFCAAEFAYRFGKRGTEGGLTLEQLQSGSALKGMIGRRIEGNIVGELK
jgi:predicted NACHT family NTPase